MKFSIASKGEMPWFPYPNRILGQVEAESPKEAEDNLIKSGQVSEKFRGFFNYIESHA